MRFRTGLVSLGIASMLFTGGAVIGCDDDDDSVEESVERAGERTEDAAERAADNIEDAADKTADKVKDAAD